MRAVLYNPPSSAQRKPVLPMSLLALGATLEGRHDYRIVDGNLEADPHAAVLRAMEEDGADLLAVTVMPGPQLEDAVPLATLVKEHFPHRPIVWGGYFPTQHWDVSLRSPAVDFVVRGHGELVFRELLDRLEAGDDPGDLAGLAVTGDDGEPRSNLPAPVPSPDELPFYPYHRLDVERYVRPTFLGRRTLPHHSSYGCPFFCNFCAVVTMVEGRWLAESAERTAGVVEGLVRDYSIDAVELYDNNFFVMERRTRELADRIRPLGLSWWGEARIDTLMKYSDATWEAMRASGLKMVFLGAESGSDETLRRMDKGGRASVEATLELAGRMKAYGVVPEMSFVLGNPPDPEADAEATFGLIRRIKRVNPATEIILYLYTPVPLAGTLYDDARAGGFAFPETLEEWISPEWREFSQRRSHSIPWLGDPLRRRIRDFERVLNAYYPTSTDRRLTGGLRALLRTLSWWRYRFEAYAFPLELRLLQRVIGYQRPETTGF